MCPQTAFTELRPFAKRRVLAARQAAYVAALRARLQQRAALRSLLRPTEPAVDTGPRAGRQQNVSSSGATAKPNIHNLAYDDESALVAPRCNEPNYSMPTVEFQFE
jgi:hypothetical protein